METAPALRYLAALLGLASGVLALVKSLSIDDTTGHRRLTRAGRIFCALIVPGGLIAILSVYVEGQKTAKTAREAEVAEATRRREVNAQTSLRRLAITWTFDHDPAVRNEPSPVVDRPRRCDVRTALTRDGERATIRWELDPVCIAKGVDRADMSVPPDSQLPDQLTMVLLTSINDFPKSPENFATWDKSLLWTPRTAIGHTFSDHSRVKLVANESQSVDLRSLVGSGPENSC